MDCGFKTVKTAWFVWKFRSKPVELISKKFPSIVNKVQIFNSRSPFAYECSLSEAIASSKCYTESDPPPEGAKLGQLYIETEVTVTILDKDHAGYMQSDKSINYWQNDYNIEHLKDTMNQIFTDTLNTGNYDPSYVVSF